jgi:GH18 family chitinase
MCHICHDFLQEYSINYYLKEGADPDKLVVGLPTYGRSYNLFNVDSYDIDAPSSGPGTKGKYTKEPGYLAYYEVRSPTFTYHLASSSESLFS